MVFVPWRSFWLSRFDCTSISLLPRSDTIRTIVDANTAVGDAAMPRSSSGSKGGGVAGPSPSPGRPPLAADMGTAQSQAWAAYSGRSLTCTTCNGRDLSSRQVSCAVSIIEYMKVWWSDQVQLPPPFIMLFMGLLYLSAWIESRCLLMSIAPNSWKAVDSPADSAKPIL